MTASSPMPSMLTDQLRQSLRNAQDQVNALALYRRMLPLVKMVGGHRYVSASKVALDYMGLPVGIPRAPRLPLPSSDTAELKAHLDRLQLKNSIPLP